MADTNKFWRAALAASLLTLAACNSAPTDTEEPSAGATISALDQQLLDASSAGDPAKVAQLLEQGANPDAQGSEGYRSTPLMLAVSVQDAATVRALLEAGADIDKRDKSGDPAINYAAYYGHEDMVRLLLDRGARTDLVGHGDTHDITLRFGREKLTQMVAPDTSLPPYLAAAKAGDAASIERLDGEGADARDRSDRGALHLAALSGDLAAVRAVAEGGGTIDGRDRIGFTPLTIAARDGHGEIVAFLLERGADPMAVASKSGLGMRPHFMAAIMGHDAVLTRLLDAGADASAEDSDGTVALMWALGEGQAGTAMTLFQRGGADTLDGAELERVANFSRKQGYDALADAVEARLAKE